VLLATDSLVGLSGHLHIKIFARDDYEVPNLGDYEARERKRDERGVREVQKGRKEKGDTGKRGARVAAGTTTASSIDASSSASIST
jgi:hypothetical protein